MLVVVTRVLAGCTPSDVVDDTCTQDTDCGTGQRCDLATGQCVAQGDRNLLCIVTADCAASELCHPTAKVCVRTCRASADCPDATKTCDAVSATDLTKVCQCATDVLCNEGRQKADLVCSKLDKVCTPRCVANADCGSGRTCDTVTGQCEVRVERSLSCAQSSDCLATELCHPTSKVCVQACGSSTDCPDSARTCDALSTTDSRKVCQCTTDALCNLGRATADRVCSTLDRVCAPRCTTDAACGPDRTCDTATGQCEKAEGLRCQGDPDCRALELCHPTAKVCVRTCASSADCPDSAKTCDALTPTDARKVCRCSTDALCNADRDTADRVCSTLESVCRFKCTADTECGGMGRVCDTAAGQCKVGSGTGAPCVDEGQSTCTYGTHFCKDSLCAPLPEPTCVNSTRFANKELLGTTGPILYNARLVSSATDTAACGTVSSKRVKIALSAYSSLPFPPRRQDVSGFFYVRVDGSTTPGQELIYSTSDYVVSGENRERAEIVVTLCRPESTTSTPTAFYFTNGNFLCFQAND